MTGKTTVGHEEIRRWVKAHDGKPVMVKGTGEEDDPGVLRIEFPGGAGSDELGEISWDDWFTKFEHNKLAFLYQDKKANGEDSTFFKLVRREPDAEME